MQCSNLVIKCLPATQRNVIANFLPQVQVQWKKRTIIVKMSSFCYFLILILINSFGAHANETVVNYNDLAENATDYDSSNELIERPLGWLRNAQDMFATPAGHVVVQMAKELLHRSAGNSQVLSLNLTNLLIIILLKMLIFSAGMLGAGHWSGYGYGYGRESSGRSDGDSRSFNFLPDQAEAYLITGFLAAQGAGTDDCLHAAACENPRAAYEYAKAARALLGAVETFEGKSANEPRYTDLIVLMERAAYDGYRGLSCNTTQKCDGLL